MNKKGFTLVELLVVVAIIAVLSLVIVPSVIRINSNINQRLYNGKVENIESSASLYASNNDDMFNGQDEVIVYVWELIKAGYVTVDIKVDGTICTAGEAGTSHSATGCVIDPRSNTSLNGDYVILRKQGAGYTTEYVHNGGDVDTQTVTSTDLVLAVCTEFNKELSSPGSGLKGQVRIDSDNIPCGCQLNGTGVAGLVDKNGNAVDSCIVSGENPNNYLRYGDSKPNWRVLGIYKIDGNYYAKIITSEPV